MRRGRAPGSVRARPNALLSTTSRPIPRSSAWALAQQSSRKLTSAILATRTGDAAFQADVKFADVRFRPCVNHQSLQPRAQPKFPIKFQAAPCRRSPLVAAALFRTGSSVWGKLRRVGILLTEPPLKPFKVVIYKDFIRFLLRLSPILSPN